MLRYIHCSPALVTMLLALLGSFLGCELASAESHNWRIDGQSYQRARQAVDAGEILPVSQILRQLNQQLEGEIISVELEYEHQTWVYEFMLLQADGRLQEVYINASDGAVLPEWSDFMARAQRHVSSFWADNPDHDGDGDGEGGNNDADGESDGEDGEDDD